MKIVCKTSQTYRLQALTISRSFSGLTLTATRILAGAGGPGFGMLSVLSSAAEAPPWSFVANLEIGLFLNGDLPFNGDLFGPRPDRRLDFTRFIFHFFDFDIRATVRGDLTNFFSRFFTIFFRLLHALASCSILNFKRSRVLSGLQKFNKIKIFADKVSFHIF